MASGLYAFSFLSWPVKKIAHTSSEAFLFPISYGKLFHSLKKYEMRGYIPIKRSLFNHNLFLEKRSFSFFEAWLDLIQLVSFVDDNKTLVRGKLVKTNRGEKIASIRFLMERWQWGSGKVQEFLKLLEDEEMVVISKASGLNKITLVNFEKHNQIVTNGEDNFDKKTVGKKRGNGHGKNNTLDTDTVDVNGDASTQSGTIAARGLLRLPIEKRHGKRHAKQHTLKPTATEFDDKAGTQTGTDNGTQTARKRHTDGTNIIKSKEGKKGKHLGAGAPVCENENEKVFAALQIWMKKYAPRVNQLSQPLTEVEYDKLRNKYSKEIIKKVLMGMQNKKDLLKKYVSAYLTITNWSEREQISSFAAAAKGDTTENVNEKIKQIFSQNGHKKSE